MAAPVGSLIVRIGSDIRGLTSGMGRGKKTVRDFGTAALQVSKRIALIGSAAAAAGAAILTKLTKSGLESVDAMVKLGRTLGATQAEMAALNRVADRAGIEQKRLESNIQAFNKRLGEAIEGSGQAKGTLDKLGISAKALADLPLSERMAIVGEKISLLSTKAEQAAATSDLFSRAGLRMANFFENLNETLPQAVKDTQDFGIAVSQIEANQVERANDALTRIAQVSEGLRTQLAVKLAPVLEEIADRLVDSARASKGFGDTISSSLAVALKIAGFFGDAIVGWQLLFQGVAVAVAKVAEIVLKIADGALNLVIPAINEIIAALNKIPKIDIEPLATDGGIAELIKTEAAIAEKTTEALGKKLQDLLDQEAPSKNVEKFLEAVEARSRKAAKELADLEEKLSLRGGAGGGADVEDERRREQEAEELDERKKFLDKRVELIRQSLLTEQAAEAEAFTQKLLQVREARDLELIGKQDADRIEEGLERQHQDRLSQITEDGLNERQQFARVAMRQKLGLLAVEFSRVTSQVANQNKALFELNKGAAIAEAVVQGLLGAERTWDAYPYPWNIAFTALHIAGTAARIAAISSQQFSGRGSTAPSVAGATPAGATPVVPVQAGGGGAAQATTVNIALQGDRFDRSQVRELITEINAAVADGARIRVT